MNLGPMEIFLIVFVLVLLFGAKKIPDLARGTGRGLRIFKAETKGLMDDDDESMKTEAQRTIEARRATEADPYGQQAQQYGQQPAQPYIQPVTQPTYESQPRTDRDR